MKSIKKMLFTLTILLIIYVSIQKNWASKDLEPLDVKYTWLETTQTYSIANNADFILGNYSIEIPIEYNGYPVTKIEDGTFSNIDGETTIAIPDSIIEIGENAFENCHDVTTIEIPSSIIKIGHRTFSSCENLKKIKVSKDNPVYHSTGNCLINTEGKTLLIGCINSIIPEDGSVTAIADFAFYNCPIKELTIPNTITYIGSSVFGSNLETVTFSSSVTYIEYDAFSGNKFTICAPKDSYAANWAIENAYKLTYIDDYYDSNANTRPETYDLVFKQLNDTSYIILGAKPNLAADIILPEKYLGLPVVAIGDNAFLSSRNLRSVELASSIVAIGNGAFKDCINLTSITFSDSLESIGGNAFWGCSKLKEITLPSSLISIDDYAFNNCGDDGLIIYAEKDSYAAEWAVSKGFIVNNIQ